MKKNIGFIVIVGVLAAIAYTQFAMPTSSYANGKVTLPGDNVVSWPPEMGKPYPDLVLLNHQNKWVRLSDLKGKVLLIEPIGMNCPACNGFAGGKEKGGFNGMQPQQGLESIKHYFSQYVDGVKFDDARIIHIHLLLYDYTMQGPDAEDALAWAKHFGLENKPNTYVLAGGKELINQASYDLIPGFQLVDKAFILRGDSTGHRPQEGLDSLLSKVKSIVEKN